MLSKKPTIILYQGEQEYFYIQENHTIFISKRTTIYFNIHENNNILIFRRTTIFYTLVNNNILNIQDNKNILISRRTTIFLYPENNNIFISGRPTVFLYPGEQQYCYIQENNNIFLSRITRIFLYPGENNTIFNISKGDLQISCSVYKFYSINCWFPSWTDVCSTYLIRPQCETISIETKSMKTQQIIFSTFLIYIHVSCVLNAFLKGVRVSLNRGCGDD